jgi:hypothetical protein
MRGWSPTWWTGWGSGSASISLSASIFAPAMKSIWRCLKAVCTCQRAEITLNSNFLIKKQVGGNAFSRVTKITFNARKYLRRIIEASDCWPIARTLDFWIMPQIHFWFLHYSLLNILTRLPENYIEHQEFFVNSDFFAKICNIFYKSNSFY